MLSIFFIAVKYFRKLSTVFIKQKLKKSFFLELLVLRKEKSLFFLIEDFVKKKFYDVNFFICPNDVLWYPNSITFFFLRLT